MFFYTVCSKIQLLVKKVNNLNYQSLEFQDINSFTISTPSKRTEILRNLLIYKLPPKSFKCLVSLSILNTQRIQTTFRKKKILFIEIYFMPFFNYWKSKTIFRSSLGSHVYWDNMYKIYSLNRIILVCYPPPILLNLHCRSSGKIYI